MLITVVALMLAIVMFVVGYSRRRTLATACLAVAAAFVLCHVAVVAHAQELAGSGSAIASGSGSSAGIATSPPTDAGGIFGRLASDWHDGKLLDAVVVGLFGLVLLARALPKIGPWLSQGRRAAVVAGVLAALTTGITTLASKTVTFDWFQGVLSAGILMYLHPNPTQNAEAKAAAATP